jgi:protein involved in polysaccharide export with SLBB domain
MTRIRFVARRLKLLSRVTLLSLLGSLSAPVRAQLAAPAPARFTLEPGDVVKVTVWREKDLNCECRVDEAGRLTLPLLGLKTVTGIPWEDLRDSLLSHYARELRNPSVLVTPMRRVQVLGEVTKPGVYLADPTVSLAGLVALAGGATPGGDLHRIRVVRAGETIVRSTSVESMLLDAGVHSNDQVFVDRRAWIERNGAFVASALISTASILVALIRR